MRRLIEKMIKAELPDAEVISCASGAEVLKQMEIGVVDLVTTALALPDMDGMSLSKQIRKNSPQRYIPIILVSGELRSRMENLVREIEHVELETTPDFFEIFAEGCMFNPMEFSPAPA